MCLFFKLNNFSRQLITTLVCINAAGQVVLPMHVFPGDQFHGNAVEGGVYGSYVGRLSNGWMDSDIFYGWLSNHFVNWIPPACPFLLLLDGHSSHINLLLPSLPKPIVFFSIVCLLIQLMLFSHVMSVFFAR